MFKQDIITNEDTDFKRTNYIKSYAQLNVIIILLCSVHKVKTLRKPGFCNRTLIGNIKAKNRFPTCLSLKEILIEVEMEISTELIKYFCNVGKLLDNLLSPSTGNNIAYVDCNTHTSG